MDLSRECSQKTYTHARVEREIKYFAALKYLRIKDLSEKWKWRSVCQLDVCFRSHSALLSPLHVLSAVFLSSNCLKSASCSLQWRHYVCYLEVLDYLTALLQVHRIITVSTISFIFYELLIFLPSEILSRMGKTCRKHANIDTHKLVLLDIFFTVQQPLLCQVLLNAEASRSRSDTPHSVGLLCTNDQPNAETSTWQHCKETDIHAPGGIRTRNPSKRGAADPRLRPRVATHISSKCGLRGTDSGTGLFACLAVEVNAAARFL